MYDQFQKYNYCKNNDELDELKWIVDDTLDVWNKNVRGSKMIKQILESKFLGVPKWNGVCGKARTPFGIRNIWFIFCIINYVVL